MIINLTPHPVVVCTADGRHSFAPSGQVARVQVHSVHCGDLQGIPLHCTEFGAVEGLPDPITGRTFVVSALVRSHPSCRERLDVVSPAGLLRDVNGSIIGCSGFDTNYTLSRGVDK